MRPTSFAPETLRTYLRRHTIASLPELKQALGTPAALTVFRKLKQLGYLSSYTHRGRFYTLREIARFDEDGLWSHEDVWFSRHGTLVATLEAWITPSPQGWFGDELAERLHVAVQDPLQDLVRRGRVRRTEIRGPVSPHRGRSAAFPRSGPGLPRWGSRPAGRRRLGAAGLTR